MVWSGYFHSYPAASRFSTLRHRPRRDGSTWLAQEAEIGQRDGAPGIVIRIVVLQQRIVDSVEPVLRGEGLGEIAGALLRGGHGAERGLRRAYGALVYHTSPLIAEQTGLQQGDVILQINNTPIRNAQDVAKAIEYYGSRVYLRVIFERQGQVAWTEFAVR